MDKELSQKVKELLQKKKYPEVLNVLKPALKGKDPSFDVLMYASKCNIELKRFDEAEELLLKAEEKKPDDKNLLQAFLQVYAIKNKIKAVKYIDKLCLDFEKTGNLIEKVCELKSRKFDIALETEDFPLLNDALCGILASDSFPVKDKLKNLDLFVEFSIKMKSSNLDNKVLESIEIGFKNCKQELEPIDDILNRLFFNFEKINSGVRVKEFESFIKSAIKILKFTVIPLKFVIRNVWLFIENIEFLSRITEEVICLLVENEFTYERKNLPQEMQLDNYRDLIKYSKHHYAEASYAGKQLLTFLFRFLKYEAYMNLGVKMQSIFKEILNTPIETNQDVRNWEETYKFITVPLRIIKINDSGNSSHSEKLIKQFKSIIYDISKVNSVNKIEEIQARISITFQNDRDDLLDLKNKLKLRIRQSPHNIVLLMLFYEYQLKIARNYRIFDEDYSLIEIIEKILALEPNNALALTEKAWLLFAKDQTQVELIEKTLEQALKLAIEDSSIVSLPLIAKIKKRLGILYFTVKRDDNEDENFDNIKSLFEDSWQKNPQDYQILICLAIISYLEEDFTVCYQLLRKAFLIFPYDQNLNKFLFFTMTKIKRNKEAFDFLKRIYEGFRNHFWINYTLAIHLLNNNKFDEAEEYLQVAAQIVETEKKYEKQPDLDFDLEISIPYLVNQNQNFILEDYIIMADKEYLRVAPHLSQNYFKTDSLKKEAKLWHLMGVKNKNVGKIVAAEKCLIESLEILSKGERTPDDSVEALLATIKPDTKAGTLIKLADLILSELFCSGNPERNEYLKKINITKYPQELSLLLYDYAAVDFYLQKDSRALLKLHSALELLAIRNSKIEVEQKADIESESDIVSFLLEVMMSTMRQTYKHYSFESARMRLEGMEKIISTYSSINKNFGTSESSYLSLHVLKDYYSFSGNIKKSPEQLQKAIDLTCLLIDKLFDKEITFKEFISGDSPIASTQFYVIISGWNDHVLFGQLKNYIYDYLLLLLCKDNLTRDEKKSQASHAITRVLMTFGDSDPRFWNLLGIQERDVEKKFKIFVKTLNIDRTNYMALDNLGYIFLSQGSYEKAVNFFLKSVELKSDNVRAYLGMVLVCLLYNVECLELRNGVSSMRKRSIQDYNYYQDLFAYKAMSYIGFVNQIQESRFSLLLEVLHKAISQYSTGVLRSLSCVFSDDFQKEDEIYCNYFIELVASRGILVAKQEEIQRLEDILEIKGFSSNKELEKLREIVLGQKTPGLVLEDLTTTLIKDLNEEGKKVNEEIKLVTQTVQKDISIYEINLSFESYLEKINFLIHISLLNLPNKNSFSCVTKCLQNITRASESPDIHLILQTFKDKEGLYSELLKKYLLLIKHHEKCEFFTNGEKEDLAFWKENLLKTISNYQSSFNYKTKNNLWPFCYVFNKLPVGYSFNKSTHMILSATDAHVSGDSQKAFRSIKLACLFDPSDVNTRNRLKEYSVLVLRKQIEKDLFYENKKDHLIERKTKLIKAFDSERNPVKRARIMAKGILDFPEDARILYLFSVAALEKGSKLPFNIFNNICSIIMTKLLTPSERIKIEDKKIVRRSMKLLIEAVGLFKKQLKTQAIVTDINKADKKILEIEEFIQSHCEFSEKMKIYERKIDLYLNLDDSQKLKELFGVLKAPSTGSLKQLKEYFLISQKVLLSNKESKGALEVVKSLKDISEKILDSVRGSQESKGKKTEKCIEKQLIYLSAYGYLIALNDISSKQKSSSTSILLRALKENISKLEVYQDRYPEIYILMMNYSAYLKEIENMQFYYNKTSTIPTFYKRVSDEVGWYFAILSNFYSVLENVSNERVYQECKEEFDRNWLELKRITKNSSVLSFLHFLKAEILRNSIKHSISEKKAILNHCKMACLHQPANSSTILNYFKDKGLLNV